MEWWCASGSTLPSCRGRENIGGFALLPGPVSSHNAILRGRWSTPSPEEPRVVAHASSFSERKRRRERESTTRDNLAEE